MVGKELLVVYQAGILAKLFADFAMFVEKLVEAGQFAASGVAVAVVVASTSIDIATVVTIYIAIVVAIVEAIAVFVTGHVEVRVAIVVGATLRLLAIIIEAIFLAHEGVRVLA